MPFKGWGLFSKERTLYKEVDSQDERRIFRENIINILR
ncbi:hypothetical protein MIDIC_20009 [Alphaproteobacteria bacterium]